METEPYVARQRPVQLGTRMPGQVEVTSGLETGEMIISHGTLKVRDGGPVQVKAIDDGSRPIAELLEDDPDLTRASDTTVAGSSGTTTG
jgi:membrane fusion protein (multidrug efflux system)